MWGVNKQKLWEEYSPCTPREDADLRAAAILSLDRGTSLSQTQQSVWLELSLRETCCIPMFSIESLTFHASSFLLD